MKNITQYILEAKESIVIGGLTFKEGSKVIYLKKYKDDNGDDVEEEISGTIEDILPTKINIRFEDNYGDEKHVMIKHSDLVGICYSAKTYKVKVDYKIIAKYEDELDSVNYEIDDIINQINQVNNDMEEEILDRARQLWHKDNPNKSLDEFSTTDDYKYIDKVGSSWDPGIDKLEKQLDILKSKKDKIEKKLNNYWDKSGGKQTSKGRIKYIKGYTPIE